MQKLQLSDVWDTDKGIFILSVDSIRKFHKYFEPEKRYKHDGRIIESSLSNKDEEIYFRVMVINHAFSTRMGADDCFELSGVLSMNKDKVNKALETTSDTERRDLVQEIINECKRLPRKPFSFITKYFSVLSRLLYKRDVFPIYDGVVARMLDYYYGKKIITKFNGSNKDYASFFDAMTDILNKINLGNNTPIKFKELDDYLWNLGRKVENELRTQISLSKRPENGNGNRKKEIFTIPGTTIQSVIDNINKLNFGKEQLKSM
jgi:hypothetical protein